MLIVFGEFVFTLYTRDAPFFGGNQSFNNFGFSTGATYRAPIGALPRSNAPLWALKGAPTGVQKRAPGSQKGAPTEAQIVAPTEAQIVAPIGV